MEILRKLHSRELPQQQVQVKVVKNRRDRLLLHINNNKLSQMEGKQQVFVCDSNQSKLPHKVIRRPSSSTLHPHCPHNPHHDPPRVPISGDHLPPVPHSVLTSSLPSQHYPTSTTNPSTTCHHKNPSNKFLRKLHRKSSGWRPSFCILAGLAILLLPLTMSSPVPNERSSSSHSSNSPPGSQRHARHSKWINPCKFSTALAPPKSVSQAENMQMYRNIIDATHKAIIHAREFMPRYYEEIFGEKLNPGHLKDFHEPWLVDVMKRVGKYLGEDVEPNALADLDVSEHLRAMYEGLQKFSVGLEQLVLDQSVYSGSFHANFHECEFKLKYILCEIQIAMWEKQIPYTDQTRDLMEQRHRDIDSATQRNIRDWVIFKDYVTTLEYLIQTFNYFLVQAEKSK